MVESEFQGLLRELGLFLEIEIPNLQKDSCILKFKDGTKIQIELTDDQEHVTIFSALGELPVGRYREDIFVEALKWNGRAYPRHGNFAFSKRTDQLTMHETLPLKDLSGEKLNDFVVLFMANAKTWRDAIKSGRLPDMQDSQIQGQRASGGLFGLRP